MTSEERDEVVDAALEAQALQIQMVLNSLEPVAKAWIESLAEVNRITLEAVQNDFRVDLLRIERVEVPMMELGDRQHARTSRNQLILLCLGGVALLMLVGGALYLRDLPAAVDAVMKIGGVGAAIYFARENGKLSKGETSE